MSAATAAVSTGEAVTLRVSARVIMMMFFILFFGAAELKLLSFVVVAPMDGQIIVLKEKTLAPLLLSFISPSTRGAGIPALVGCQGPESSRFDAFLPSASCTPFCN